MADLTVFVTVAEERSFTRAAAKLGISQSAISQTVKRLEMRTGLRLLTRTTRSVAPTQAGDRLLQTLAPTLRELDASIAALGESREKPAGTIRITSIEHPTRTILLPALARLLPQYPDIHVEIVDDYSLFDVVSDRFDAGVRLGHQVARDMIAVAISPETPMAVVVAPNYLSLADVPTEPRQLVNHRCICLRLPTSETLYSWNFARKGRGVRINLQSPLVFNSLQPILQAANAGLGLAYLPTDMVRAQLDDGSLIELLPDWTPPLPAYHLYYPNRRRSPAFRLLIDALRYRGDG